MKKKTTIKLGALLLVLAIMLSSLTGISAYFTDTDTATNTFTVGEVSIDLQEPSWDGDTDTTPNMTTPKDPQVLNDGVSDAFVFLEVSVPYADNIVIADADGTKNTAATAELFTYTIKDGWVEVGTPTTDAEAGVVKHVYAYIGDNASDLKALAANETTPTLFDEITFVNVVENQGLETTELDVVINAYGIQTNDINGGKTDPAGVWEVVMNRYNVAVDAEIQFNYSFPDDRETNYVVMSNKGNRITFAIQDNFFELKDEYGTKEEIIEMFGLLDVDGGYYADENVYFENSDSHDGYLVNATPVTGIEKNVSELALTFDYVGDGLYVFVLGPFGIRITVSAA